MNSTFLIVLLIYLGFMILIGYFASKKSDTLDSFFVADRSLGLLITVGTFAATFASSSSIIGQVGWLYDLGWSGLWAIGGTLTSIAIGSIFVMGRLREVGEHTIPDFFANRYYSETMRIIPVILIIFLYTIFITVEVMGAAKTLEVLLNLNYNVACIIVTVIFVSYTMAGGMFAVAWTDTIQMFIGFGGIIAAIFTALNSVGGFTNMNLKLAEINSDLVAPYTGGLGAAVMFIIWNHVVWGIGNISQPSNLQRAFSAKDSKTARLGTAISGLIFVTFYFCTMILGGVSRILYPNLQDLDHAFPVLVQNLYHPIFGSILLCAILAMIMSTTDSVLLVAGAAIGNDLYKKRINKEASDKDVIKVSRLGMIAIGAISLILALIKPSTVFYLQIFNYSTIGTAFFIPLVVGLYWKRANKEGAIASMIGGATTNLIWYALGEPFGLHPVIPGVIVGIALMYIVSLSTEAPPESVINVFFNKSKVSIDS